jgi:hypothetical protein
LLVTALAVLAAFLTTQPALANPTLAVVHPAATQPAPPPPHRANDVYIRDIVAGGQPNAIYYSDLANAVLNAINWRSCRGPPSGCYPTC